MRSEYKVIKEIEGKYSKIIDATILSVCLKLFSLLLANKGIMTPNCLKQG